MSSTDKGGQRGSALTSDAVAALIPENQRFRWAFEFHDTVSSTMDVARERASGGCDDGLVVVGAEQSQGRGRRGNRWDSPRGGLWLSVVMRPGMEGIGPGDGRVSLGRGASGLTIAAALAAAGACEDAAGVDVRVKWPNDLYVGDAKVGGVMGEGNADFIVLGVGVNVNIMEKSLPRAEHYETVSLRIESGRPVDSAILLAAFLTRLGRAAKALEERGMPALMSEWRKRSLERGRPVVVERAGEVLRGVAVDIGDDGSLIMDVEGSRIVVAAHGDVTMGPAGARWSDHTENGA